MKFDMAHEDVIPVPVDPAIVSSCVALHTQSQIRWYGLLLLFILLQFCLGAAYLAYHHHNIEENTANILRNTAILQADLIEGDIEGLRYQIRVIGDAILLNHTVSLDNAAHYLTEELEKQDFLDAVILFDANGDFVAKQSLFPLEYLLKTQTLARESFRDNRMFEMLRSTNNNEGLFYIQSNGLDQHSMGFVIYRAIHDSQGRYLGGIIGYIRARVMQDLFKEMQNKGFNLGPDGTIAVFDRHAAIQLARMGAGADSAVHTFEPRLRPLMDYANGSTEIHHYDSPMDGISRMGVFLNVNDKKWVLVVGMARHDMLGSWYLQVFWVTVVLIALAILQWWLLKHIHIISCQRECLAREARQDPLTGLANRRRFNEWAQHTCSLAQRHRLPLCVMALDLDFFKQINDSYGHDGGDAVLRCVANTLQGQLRSCDIAARFGGEEFVVAMPHTELDAAADVAERIRTNLISQELIVNQQRVCFTASFGLAQMTPGELDANEGIYIALARADQALYRSKQEGRNRVTVA